MTVATPRPSYAGWRAAAATLLVLPAAVIAHTWAGGHVPGLPMVLLLAGVLYTGSLAFLRHTLPATVLLPAVAAAQAGLHASFAASAPAPMTPADLEMAGHAHHQMAGSPWSGRMLVAHAAVTVLTALVWRLCQRAALAVLAATGLLTSYAAGPRDPRRTPPSAPLPGRRFALLVSPRRGPPVALRHA